MTIMIVAVNCERCANTQMAVDGFYRDGDVHGRCVSCGQELFGALILRKSEADNKVEPA
jgi:transposase-like protein